MVTQRSIPVETLSAAFARARAIRPPVNGFPVLAEVLRGAGVLRNEWHLPAAQSRYDMRDGSRPDAAGDAANRGRNGRTGVRS